MESYLPELKGMVKGIRHGRNVYEGYQRGWGLQFGGLKEMVLIDPLYKEAFSVARDRTIMSEENRMNIFLLLRFFSTKYPSGTLLSMVPIAAAVLSSWRMSHKSCIRA